MLNERSGLDGQLHSQRGIRRDSKRRKKAECKHPACYGFGINLAFFIHNNTDIVVLTLFSSLSMVSVYSVYNMIANALKCIVLAISSAIIPNIGRAISDERELKTVFEKYESIIYSCGGITIY